MPAGSENLITNLPFGNVIGNAANNAGKFAARCKGKGWK